VGKRCRAGLGAGLALMVALVAWSPLSSSAHTPSMDPSGLARGPYSTLRTLLQKTIFRIDVLTLEIRVDEGTRRRIEELARHREYSRELADAISAVALETRDAWIRIRLLRNVSLSRFVGGIRDGLKQARKAGLITAQNFRYVSESLPQWFAFLEERELQKGDQILYRIQGDAMRTVYQGVRGERLLDKTDHGADARLAVLGSYFAPESDFREGLVRSLFRGRE